METAKTSPRMTINTDKDAEISLTDGSSVYLEQPVSLQCEEVSVSSSKTDADVSMNCIPTTGIEANDIGSLFEQFMEYEQGSEADIGSYPDSSFLTPVGSPGECNEDVVLGRLMIVQEKLSQEVASNVPGNDDNKGEDNNNHTEIKSDGLLRTVNGIHPKGTNIRMADSPKFAKFKKKKLSSDPPLRRCVSGPSTPRCTSPSDIVSPEEMKRREVKLIEALALTIPKQTNKSDQKKTEADRAKRNLSAQKHSYEEHIPSRLMPVVSKRRRLEQSENAGDPRSTGKISADPRLNKLSYGEKSNVIQLKNTKLVEVNSSTDTRADDDNDDDDTRIVDMTIDHETLAESMLTVPHTKLKNEPAKVTEVVAVPKTNEVKVEQLNHSDNNNQSDSPTGSNAEPIKQKSSVVKPPKNYRRVNCSVEPEDKAWKRSLSQTSRKRRSHSGEVSPVRKRSRSPLSDHDRSSSRNLSPSPKVHSASGSRSGCSSRRSSISPTYSRSRNSSRAPSRSPSHHHSSGRSKSPENKSHSGSKRSRRSSANGSESLDISCKLSELSNPVPYDIEHERKLRFLCGGASGGSMERRNIYVGGIANGTSRVDLDERFRRFGNIEKITLHFRDKGDNYAFIVFDEPENAMRAIEEGNDDPEYPPLELCFGGRRTFVGGSYVDFDGNNEYLEEKETSSRNRCDSPEDDFDQLLKMAIRDSKKKETTPEWT